MSGSQTLSDAERGRLRATVREVLEEAGQLVEQVADPKSAELRLTDLAEYFARLGEFERAKHHAFRIQLNPSYITDCLIEIAAYQCVAGELEAARTTLLEAADSTKALDPLDRPPFIEIHMMLQVWAKYFPRDEAILLVRDALNLAETKGNDWDEGQFFDILIDLVDWEFLQSKADQMQDPEQRANRRARIAEALAESGDIKSALQLIDSIESPHTIAETMRIVGEQLARVGDQGAAHSYFQRSYEGYLLEEHPTTRSRELIGIAESFASIGDHELAEQARERALESASSQRGTDQIENLTNMASELVTQGQSQRSRDLLETAERINATKEMPYRLYNLFWIARGHHECGNHRRVEELLQEASLLTDGVDDVEEREDRVIEVASRAIRLGQIVIANDLLERTSTHGQISILTDLISFSGSTGSDDAAGGAVVTARSLIAALDNEHETASRLECLARAQADADDFSGAMATTRLIGPGSPEHILCAYLTIADKALEVVGLPRSDL